MGRLIIGLMSNAEQATITNVDFPEGCQITQTVQNTGDAKITINTAWLPLRIKPARIHGLLRESPLKLRALFSL
jgi:hypothetical protein